MLVLTRCVDEAIVIQVPGLNELIRIDVVSGGRVRLGITAPNTCLIYREEVAKEIGLVPRGAARPKQADKTSRRAASEREP